MQTERTKKIISWVLTVVCMGVIFWLSSRNSDDSSAQSSVIVEFLTRLFGDGVFNDFIVRKLAHCLEFTGLCLLMNFSLYFTRGKKSPVLSVLFTSLYAVTDEIHQLFVPGRSCEFRDWVIDTAGAVLGMCGFMVLIYIIDRISKRRNNGIDNKNN